MSGDVDDSDASDQDKHAAWLDSLSDDDRLVVHTPVGYQHLMLWAAYVKRALQGDMKAGKRLRLLERLNSITDWYFTPEMLAAIEPMCDTGDAMMREALSLDGDKGCENSFKILTSWRVFGHFRRLNPSLMTAIRLRNEMAEWLPTRQQ
jgi:hypothetical protein